MAKFVSKIKIKDTSEIVSGIGVVPGNMVLSAIINSDLRLRNSMIGQQVRMMSGIRGNAIIEGANYKGAYPYNVVKWAEVEMGRVEIRVISYSGGTTHNSKGTLVVDTDAVFQAEILTISSGSVRIFVNSIISKSPSRTVLDVTLVLIEGYDFSLSDLDAGTFIVKTHASAKEEASRDGIGMYSVSENIVTYSNPMQISRNYAAISGTALGSKPRDIFNQLCLDVTDELRATGRLDQIRAGNIYNMFYLPKQIMDFQDGRPKGVLLTHLWGILDTLSNGIGNMNEDGTITMTEPSGKVVPMMDGLYNLFRKGGAKARAWFTASSMKQAYDFFKELGYSIINSYDDGLPMERPTIVVSGGSLLRSYFAEAVSQMHKESNVSYQYSVIVKDGDIPEGSYMNKVRDLKFENFDMVFELDSMYEKNITNSGGDMLVFKNERKPVLSARGYAYLRPDGYAEYLPFQIMNLGYGDTQRFMNGAYTRGITGSGRTGNMISDALNSLLDANPRMENKWHETSSTVDADRFDVLSEFGFAAQGSKHAVLIEGISGKPK